MFATLIAATFSLLTYHAGLDAAYTFLLLPGPSPQVQVTVATAGDSDGTTELRVQSSWGGIDNDGGDITALCVTNAKGIELPSSHASATEWIVAHPPSEPLTITYIIPARQLAPLVRGNDYRTRLEPDLLHMIGELGLLLPEHLDDDASRSFSVSFRDFEPNHWNVVSSFGNGSGPFTVNGSGQSLRHSVILAGKQRTLTRTINGNTVGVAIVGENWGFEDDAFADLTATIITAERAFWNDHTDPWFLVTLIPNRTPATVHSFSIGGTGLTDAFALFCDTGLSLDAGSQRAIQVKVLLAHEYFHTWNGGKIKSAGEDGTGYWFSEGFTDFYARRLLGRAGLLSDAEHLDRLNEMLVAAASNPQRSAPASRIREDFWKNEDIQRLPYQRGDQVALAVDERIREVSHGARSLDDLMQVLLARSKRGEPYSSEVVLDLIESETDAAFAAVVRRCVVDGADVTLPSSLTAPVAMLTKATSQSFDAGLDVAATQGTKVLSGVRIGSAAHIAGLRDGQRISALSISSGTPESPPSARVTIEMDGAARTIIYDPLTPPLEVARYVAPAHK